MHARLNFACRLSLVWYPLTLTLRPLECGWLKRSPGAVTGILLMLSRLAGMTFCWSFDSPGLGYHDFINGDIIVACIPLDPSFLVSLMLHPFAALDTETNDISLLYILRKRSSYSTFIFSVTYVFNLKVFGLKAPAIDV
ncbi:hypothetical protein BU16DRAFT_527330 [Lophium mytilinum]|uniref:Uncharacterized protein n=1 Tax=Lophium mytilinum TaxID=390894 RepID=A0A6A6QTM1_9PEZI|nr:hypothetical protein BU16DRAFT_527330 [Lophium mytilinum]